MSKICFLFGAGAEAVYGIGEGVSFIKPLLTSSFSAERLSLLDKKSQYKLVYPGSKTIYLQSIVNNLELAKKVFDQTTINEATLAYEQNDNSKCQSINFKNFYDIINKEKIDELNEEDKLVYKFFLENAVFFDVLDAKFNDLRTLPLHSNGNRVINAYVTVFILMLTNLYEINKDFKWKWSTVLNLLLKPYDKVNLSAESYYSILKSTSNQDNDIWYKVFTTNYTSIAESIFGKGQVGYLHGRLNLFEDYNELRIYDAYNSQERVKILEKKASIVPFILIPSGVKPLICPQQIKEFASFIDSLNYSKFLCVIGYRLNSEDNHINSIITEWLAKKNGKLVFFKFESSVEWADIKWAKGISFKEISTEKLDEIITSDASILNISINDDNCYAVFQKVAKILKNA